MLTSDNTPSTSNPSNSSKSGNNVQAQFAPIIDRILSNPLTFQPARHPDKVTTRPSSYITFKSSKDNSNKSLATSTSEESASSSSSPMAAKPKPAPKSMAEAVANYSKRFLNQREKKELTPKPSKRAKKVKTGFLPSDTLASSPSESPSPSTGSKEIATAAIASTTDTPETELESEIESKSANDLKLVSDDEDDVAEDEDEEDDEDFQTAEENSSSSDASTSEEAEGSVPPDEKLESEITEEDLVQLKKEAYEGSDEEEEEDDEEEDEEEEEETVSKDSTPDEATKSELISRKSTPPTSPDDEDLIKGDLVQSSYEDGEFYDFDEKFNDRGSNGSTRIYKSWREFRSFVPPLGLLNHGVTCYMNSAVQALVHIPALLHYLVDVHNGEYGTTIKNDSVTKTLADTVAKMYQLDNKAGKKISYINPKRLIRRLEDINCMMSEWQQEDSHEYYMSLMSRLQEDSTPKGVKLNESIIYDIFGGLLNQTVTCRNCGHVSTTQQELYDLSLGLDNRRKRASSLLNPHQLLELKSQIDNSKSTDANSKDQMNNFLTQKILKAQEDRRSRSNTPEPNSITLSPEVTSTLSTETSSTTTTQQQQQQQQLSPITKSQKQIPVNKPRSSYSIETSLSDFFSPELLKTDKKDKSGYFCENCKKTTNAIKISTIEKAPETLTIHLKRFRFDGQASMKVKTNVSYPNILDLTEFTTSMDLPTKYKLISVLVHQGRSVSSGHYIAYCKQPDGSWSLYDDEYVNTVKPRDALTEEGAYVLVYSRLTHKSVGIPESPVKKGAANTNNNNKKPTNVNKGKKRKFNENNKDNGNRKFGKNNSKKFKKSKNLF